MESMYVFRAFRAVVSTTIPRGFQTCWYFMYPLSCTASELLRRLQIQGLCCSPRQSSFVRYVLLFEHQRVSYYNIRILPCHRNTYVSLRRRPLTYQRFAYAIQIMLLLNTIITMGFLLQQHKWRINQYIYVPVRPFVKTYYKQTTMLGVYNSKVLGQKLEKTLLQFRLIVKELKENVASFRFVGDLELANDGTDLRNGAKRCETEGGTKNGVSVKSNL